MILKPIPEMERMLESEIREVIRNGYFQPTKRVLTMAWQILERKWGAWELLANAIDGNDSLASDVLSLIKFTNPGDMGKLRLSDALCDYAEKIVADYESHCWSCWGELGRPDPMDLAKEERDRDLH